MTSKRNDEKRYKFEKYKQRKAWNLENNIPIRNIKLKKIIRPVLRKILWIQRKINRQVVEFINKEIPKVERPIVFAVSHIGKWDFEIINEQINEHFYVIASDYMNMVGNINGLFLELNGVIFMDIDSKEDRENSRKMMLKVLEKDNMMIFPEGTWNLSENEIIRDIHFGTVDIALEKNAVIVPIAIEQYGKRFVINVGTLYEPNIFVAAMMNQPYCSLNDKNEEERKQKWNIKLKATEELRDRLATLKYEIWEKEGITQRANIPYDYWKKFIIERCVEWAGYTMDEQIRNGCFPCEKKKYREMIEQICKMLICEKNQFLFSEEIANRSTKDNVQHRFKTI